MESFSQLFGNIAAMQAPASNYKQMVSEGLQVRYETTNTIQVAFYDRIASALSSTVYYTPTAHITTDRLTQAYVEWVSNQVLYHSDAA